MSANTLFLRLEGPLQSWGDQESKFVVRRTADAPTKSGVIGLICCAMGLSRDAARERLPKLNALAMGVRIDRPGIRWWDWHTVGAKMEMRIAGGEGKSKPGAMLTRREYLCDASFLVVLHGDAALIDELHQAVLHPQWPMYLGRKSCPPSLPLMGGQDEPDLGEFPDHVAALKSVQWRPRMREDPVPDHVICLLEWRPGKPGDLAPADAEVWYNMAESFDVPAHGARLVIRKTLSVGDGKNVAKGKPRQGHTPASLRPRANYQNGEYKRMRGKRLEQDQHLCVFCKAPATTVQHVTYRHAGGDERIEELRALCRLCHDAVTMIEYGQNMGLDRINPEESRWRDQIIKKRDEIIAFRSLETRRRSLRPEEVE
jgi:CRISPR system Cascade subunit CasD